MKLAVETWLIELGLLVFTAVIMSLLFQWGGNIYSALGVIAAFAILQPLFSRR